MEAWQISFVSLMSLGLVIFNAPDKALKKVFKIDDTKYLRKIGFQVSVGLGIAVLILQGNSLSAPVRLFLLGIWCVFEFMIIRSTVAGRKS